MHAYRMWAAAALALLFLPRVLFALPGGEALLHKKTLSRTADPIIITGDEIAHLSGKEIGRLRLFAYREGVLHAIPFQVDQRDSQDDWVWDVPLRGGQAWDDQDPQGEKVLDDNDLLIFLAKDIGSRGSPAGELLQAGDTWEIEIEDPAGDKRGWAYLAYFDSDPPPLSIVRYMRFSLNERRIVSPFYELAYSTEHIAVMKDMAFAGKSVMDRFKVRGEAEMRVGFIKSSFHFNEEDVGGYLEGYIDGPVRTLWRSVNYVHLPLGLRTPRINCDHFFYPEHAEIPLLLSLRFLVDRASLLLTADYRGNPFKRAFFADPRPPVNLGTGKAREDFVETAFDKRWIVLEDGGGTLLSLIQLPDDVARYSTVSLFLNNDPGRKNPPEDYPGSEPEAGFRLETQRGLPKGDYILYLIFFVSTDPYQPGDEKKAVQLLNRKLIYRSLKQ